MTEWISRTERLYGKEGIEKLAQARVAIFGIGGVGGYVAEALVRSGIGAFDLIDNDKVCLSNLNRQIIATEDTVGRPKTQVAKERMLSINPLADIRTHVCFYLPENRKDFDFSRYTWVVDAVDTVTAKLDIIMAAREAGVPVISSMGAGNKIHPELFELADIYETSVCPLAKVMRRLLRKQGVESLPVVYSREEPRKNVAGLDGEKESRKPVPGSTAFCPSVAGLIIAGQVVNSIAGIK